MPITTPMPIRAKPAKRAVPAQFRNRHRLEIYRLTKGATFTDSNSTRTLIGEMYADRRDVTGAELAANLNVPGYSEIVYFYADPTFKYELTPPRPSEDDAIGEGGVGENPVGGDAGARGKPMATVGVPYKRGDYIKDTVADEVLKIVAIRDTSTQRRRVEITARRNVTT